MFETLGRLLEIAQEPFQVKASGDPNWRESADVCALADEERHLGHAIRAGKCWIAYDGVHLSPGGQGFRIIGTFQTISAAKQAIEETAGISSVWAAGAIVEPAASVRPRRANHFGI